ncbi:MAG: 30S ribosomal protein S16 [Dehalococcoidia bacterium]|nr:MAG: 30S ribosomal protein S16 [Dehalococcoidia bacterium]
MLRIRLRRTGQKHQPSYRIVVAHKETKRDGGFLEIVGHYNPTTEPRTLQVNAERTQYWLSVGAQPSETVARLLFSAGVTTVEPKRRVTQPTKAEREATEAAKKAHVEAVKAKKDAEAAAAKAAEEAAKAAAAEAAAAGSN